jgi:acyl transferase domain-containing protein
VLFSSISATWGSGLQSAYAAANAYLDALADHRLAHGLPATSVAWGPWGGGGMTDADGAAQGIRRGLLVMEPGPAVRALAQILDAGEGLLTVADVDWARFAPPFTLRRPSPLIGDLPAVKQALETGTPAAAGDLGTGSDLRQRLAGLPRADQLRILDPPRADPLRGHPGVPRSGRGGGEPGLQRARLRLADRGRTAQPARRRHRPATAGHPPVRRPTPVAVAEFLRGELAGVRDAAPAARVTTAAGLDEPIAIVAMSCRYPGGVRDPEGLWELVAAGTDAVSGFPRDRGWDEEALYDPDPDHAGTSYVRTAGFVYDAGEFDPGFFGISPREALAMDPQQRLLLETSWEALERAGIAAGSLRGSQTGVFVGASPSGYGFGPVLSAELEGHLSTGTASSVMSGRVSYLLGLEGPAVTVDTACSSSLVALHLACQALRSGECTLALAGGVTVMVSPAVFVLSSRQRGLAADGRCKPFGAAADGMGMSEGAGMLLVERLSDARRNGHRVLAVVRGSAVNQDGASNGLTAPNGPSQQRVIRAALANAGLSAADVDAVEAHGTGTELGDPIEAQALLATYGQGRPDGSPLWLGSVKSNIGHPQQAAGVAGVIKTVLALQHGVLPRTLHADEPSPHVDWSSGAVRLLTQAVPWAADGHPRRAGVSAFGMSGTNVHTILEEAPAGEPAPPGAGAPLVSDAMAWVLSARTADGLAAQAQRLAAHLAAGPGLDPADVGWSLAAGRSVFDYRAVVTGRSREALDAGLAAAAAGASWADLALGMASDPGKVVFVFPGQGSQWAGMGRELAACCPVFAARLAECGQALAPYVDWSLDEVIAGVPGAPGLDRAEVVQPALWAVMVSLAAVWEAAGVVPDAVVGHSQGEIAAACVAGMLSLEDAAQVVAVRSRALSALGAQGGMVSVVMPATAVRELMEPWRGRLSVAAVNGPAATVVSGELDALGEFEAELSARRVLRWRVPQTDFVAHSARVEELAGPLAAGLASVRPEAGRVPLFSTAECRWMDGTELDAAYWYANVRNTVRFDEAVRELSGAGHRTFIEVSPHPVLEAGIEDTIADAFPDISPFPVISGTLNRENSGGAQILGVMSRAFARGVAVDWARVLGGGAQVDLPTYPFQRQRYWYIPEGMQGYLPAGSAEAGPGATGTGSVAEARFWAAVDGGDVERLEETLKVDGKRPFSEVLTALSSWRRRERDRSVTGSWRYRISWAPVADPAPAALAGTWLVVTPAAEPARDVFQGLRAGAVARGARVTVLELDAGAADRETGSRNGRLAAARAMSVCPGRGGRGVAAGAG